MKSNEHHVRQLKYLCFFNEMLVEDVNNIGVNICSSLQQQFNYMEIRGNIIMRSDAVDNTVKINFSAIRETFSFENLFCNTLDGSSTMNPDYLFNSMTSEEKFVLISCYAADDIHSALTFSIHEEEDLSFCLKIDAICVNNRKKYTGAGKMIKDLLAVCSLEPSSKVNRVTTFKLHALKNKKTIDFYNRLKFIKTSEDTYGNEKQLIVRSPDASPSVVDNTAVQQLILDIASSSPENITIENDSCIRAQQLIKPMTHELEDNEISLLGGMLSCGYDVVIKITNRLNEMTAGKTRHKRRRCGKKSNKCRQTRKKRNRKKSGRCRR